MAAPSQIDILQQSVEIFELQGGKHHAAKAAVGSAQTTAQRNLVGGGARMLLYVDNSLGDDITVIDLGALKTVDTIKVGNQPHALCAPADGRRLFTTIESENKLTTIDTVTGKIEMEQNERYAEGEATREAFARFCELALNAPASTLERVINRPIYPSRTALIR